MNKSSGNFNLTISSKTWNKETEDLFDFEAADFNTKEFKISSGDLNHYILSQENKVMILNDLQEVKKKVLEKNTSKIVGEISCKKHFQISNSFSTKNLQGFDKSYLERLWQVLHKNELRMVEEGDIIKLGRVRLKFDKIVLKQNNNFETNYHNIDLKTNTTQPLLNNNNSNIVVSSNINPFTNTNINNQSFSNMFNNYQGMINNNMNTYTNENDVSSYNLRNEVIDKNPLQEELAKLKEPQFLCKICFRSDSDIVDPLISPCKCSGSMGYIHYKCLKQCINMKINTRLSDNYVCYIWKNFECEICLAEYPKLIKYKNYNYNLVDINVNYEQYISLDYTLYDDTKKKSYRKGIIVVKVNDEAEISIGRTQINTIKLKDISVSRMHCYFIKKDNKIYVADKGSKFGTLLYLNKPFILTNEIINEQKNNLFLGNSVDVISGKSHFSLKLTKSMNIFSNFFSSTLCCKCKSTNDDEFILNMDHTNNEENDNIKIRDSNNHLNDSYCDNILNLETIIKHNDPISNNNSFI